MKLKQPDFKPSLQVFKPATSYTSRHVESCEIIKINQLRATNQLALFNVYGHKASLITKIKFFSNYKTYFVESRCQVITKFLTDVIKAHLKFSTWKRWILAAILRNNCFGFAEA